MSEDKKEHMQWERCFPDQEGSDDSTAPLFRQNSTRAGHGSLLGSAILAVSMSNPSLKAPHQAPHPTNKSGRAPTTTQVDIKSKGSIVRRGPLFAVVRVVHGQTVWAYGFGVHCPRARRLYRELAKAQHPDRVSFIGQLTMKEINRRKVDPERSETKITDTKWHECRFYDIEGFLPTRSQWKAYAKSAAGTFSWALDRELFDCRLASTRKEEPPIERWITRPSTFHPLWESCAPTDPLALDMPS